MPSFESSTVIANEAVDGPRHYQRVSAADLSGDDKVDLVIGASDSKREARVWLVNHE